MEETKEPKVEPSTEASNSDITNKVVENVVPENTPLTSGTAGTVESTAQSSESSSSAQPIAEAAPQSQVQEIKETEFFENKLDSTVGTTEDGNQKIINDDSSKSKEVVKNGTSKNSDDKLDYKTIIAVVVILLGIAMVVWYKDKQSKQGQIGTSREENINIVVDNSQEQGKVNIVETSKQELKSGEVTSSEATNGNVASTTDNNKIKVINYYSNNQNDPQMQDCSRVYPLEREAENKYLSKEINTIRNLLVPLTADEKSRGFISNIPAGTILKRLVILPGGVAEVHFTSALSKLGGSCATAAVRSQIEATLKQFTYIKTVSICIDDNCKQDEILQP